MSSRHRRDPPQSQPTLWSGTYCTACPASTVCPSFDTDDACSSTALYHPSAAHPAKLITHADQKDFQYPDFPLGVTAFDGSQRARTRVLVLSDGVHTDTVRLRGAVARLRGAERPAGGATAVLHGHDEVLFGLLEKRAQLGQLLLDAGFDTVISPCFSTWEPYPPWESLLNQSLTARLATELASQLRTIPSLAWRRHSELARWADWLVRNEQVSFALHPATMRTRNEWEWWTSGLQSLRDLLTQSGTKSPLHLYVNGPCTAQRVTDVVRIWRGDVTFLTQQPWQLAIHGKVLSADLDEVPADSESTVSELLRVSETNFDRFVRFLEAGVDQANIQRAAPRAG